MPDFCPIKKSTRPMSIFANTLYELTLEILEREHFPCGFAPRYLKELTYKFSRQGRKYTLEEIAVAVAFCYITNHDQGCGQFIFLTHLCNSYGVALKRLFQLLKYEPLQVYSFSNFFFFLNELLDLQCSFKELQNITEIANRLHYETHYKCGAIIVSVFKHHPKLKSIQQLFGISTIPIKKINVELFESKQQNEKT